jgi:hypothetical protein
MPTNWKLINDPPQKSGYVLLAGCHHRIPKVLYGFCRVFSDGKASFTEDVYNGQGMAISHWMPLPEHPAIKSNLDEWENTLTKQDWEEIRGVQ